MKVLWKSCETCGKSFAKPESCSLKVWNFTRRFCSRACHALAQRGRTAPGQGPKGIAPWNKGLKTAVPGRKVFIPCRICGEHTKYAGTKGRLLGMVSCDRPECRSESRRVRNERVREGQHRAIAEGRKPITGWRHSGVSPEEVALEPWFLSLGWSPQHCFVLGPRGRHVRLDFANPEKRLCVEIDGTSHRKPSKQAHDRERDRMLGERGWRVFRLAASVVTIDIEAAKRRIQLWVNEQAHDNPV